MKIVIDIPETMDAEDAKKLWQIAKSVTILPKGHGRLGDLEELEQRISNYVEHDVKITDDYIVARQRFIVDGIRQTPTIIEADKT